MMLGMVVVMVVVGTPDTLLLTTGGPQQGRRTIRKAHRMISRASRHTTC